MALKKIAVCDGVVLNIIEKDKFKTNYISVNFITPLSSESAALNALLPRVLKRGTVAHPDMASLNRAYETLYSTTIYSRNYKRGEVQIVGFCASPLANDYIPDGTDVLDGTLKLMDEIIFSPLLEDGCFKAEYVESEKRMLIDDVKAQINNKNRYALRRCEEEMCRGEVYGVSETGTAAEIEAITPASLYACYKALLSGAKIEIFFVGKTDEEALIKSIKDVFVKCAHTVTAPLTTEVIRKAGEAREVVEDQPVAQGKLSLGFRTNCVLSDGNYHEFALMRELYGGSTVSKLFMNVREKLSLCYYCSAIPEAHKGIMVVASGIEVANKQKAQDEILAQLEAVKVGDFTEDDLAKAKRSIVNSYTELSDSPMSLESWYLGRALAGLSTSPEDAIELVMNTGREAVMAAAQGVTLDTVYFMRGTLNAGGAENE
ncbi:MAG: insulinase family protein [Clostridia bacterium]|nr:insulinase family protein [Clostridia bacterium]